LIFESPLCWTIQDEKAPNEETKTYPGLTSPRLKIKPENHHSKEDHLDVLKPFGMNKKENTTISEFENQNTQIRT